MPRLVNLRKRGFEERHLGGRRRATGPRTHRQSALRRLGRLPEQVGAPLRALGGGRGAGARLPHRRRPRRRRRRARPLRRRHPGRPQRILVGPPARRASKPSSTRRAPGDLLRQHRASGRCAGRTAAKTRCDLPQVEGLRGGSGAAPTRRAARTSGRTRAFGRPEAAITGLSFLFGGYHRLGLCVARGAGGYTVYRDQHWALEGCDLYYGDVIGDGDPADRLRERRLPLRLRRRRAAARRSRRLGVPDEPRDHRRSRPPRSARSPAAPTPRSSRPSSSNRRRRGRLRRRQPGGAAARVLRGHAVMASFTRGEGEVFNGGTTEWAHGLAAHDPFVDAHHPERAEAVRGVLSCGDRLRPIRASRRIGRRSSRRSDPPVRRRRGRPRRPPRRRAGA